MAKHGKWKPPNGQGVQPLFSAEMEAIVEAEIQSRDDFQRRSSSVGADFERACNSILEIVGFKLEGKLVVPEAGIEIDQVAVNRKGVRFLFEAKGSDYRGKQPGLKRGDSVKKALCLAFLLDMLDYRPFVILTSHLPNKRTTAAKMLRLASRVVFDVIDVFDRSHRARLVQLGETDEDSLTQALERRAEIDPVAAMRAELRSQETLSMF